MKHTPEQSQAINDHDRNLIVVAGAGSGKTRVLVERYLALLDANPDWPLNALVAITFTRKAAQEMRDRVRQALEQRRRDADDPGMRDRWAQKLASMDGARIDTIHGLCVTILRANAAEAGLDPDFEVLDEVEAAILLEDTVEAVLEAVVVEDDPALTLFDTYDPIQVGKVLTAFAGVALADLPDDVLAYWRQIWQDNAADCLRRFRDNEGVRWCYDWQPATMPPQGDKLADIWYVCRDNLAQVIQAGDDVPPDAVVRQLGDLKAAIDLRGGSAKSWGSKEELAEARAMLRELRDLAGAYLNDIGDAPGALDEQAAWLIPYWHRLIRRVQVAFREAKRQAGLLDFDDLETLARDLLHYHPDVRRRYQGAEFRHLLVDEFQDTSSAQWDIVRALADPAVPGGLFVVGDQKQSIYAFRGADVSVFGAVRATISGSGGGAEVALARSFRTHQPLVEAFNAMFGHILAGATAAYEVDLGVPMTAQREHPPSDAPCIEALLIDTTEERESPARRDSSDWRRWEAYVIAQRVLALVASGLPVSDGQGGTRPARYDDFALLFQSLSQVTIYEDVFKSLGLPFVTVAGRGYYSRQEVWDLLNLLKALYNPADDLALASALRSPLFGLSDDALLALRLVRDAENQRLPLWDALAQAEVVPADERELARFAASCLADLRRQAGRVTISELLREALRRTGFLAVLSGLPDGARRRSNVEKLIEKAESSGQITLGAFSRYLADLSAREVREGEALVDVTGAVTLMTVHASKGLEFPVVILVDTSWERGNSGMPPVLHDMAYGLACKVYDEDAADFAKTTLFTLLENRQKQREMAERKRLLYVAATRAQDYLMFSGQIRRTKNGPPAGGAWLKWLLDALDLAATLDDGEGVRRYPWGELRLQIVREMPDDNAFAGHIQDEGSAWDSDPIQHEQPLAGPVVMPPLLAVLPQDPTAPARHLSVTQLADIGGADYDDYYGRRFRSALLHDAPAHVEPVIRDRQQGRLIGEIVHEALRWWQPAMADGLHARLDSYAWEQGVVEPELRTVVVNEAATLLHDFQQSEVAGWIAQAQNIHRELPFVYRTGARIIHGVLDLLLELDARRWIIVDYKSSYVPGASGGYPVFADHARRYHLQVGAYAAAVEAQLGNVDSIDLSVYIHYIRYRQTVAIQREAWQTALNSLETRIGDLLG